MAVCADLLESFGGKLAERLALVDTSVVDKDVRRASRLVDNLPHRVHASTGIANIKGNKVAVRRRASKAQ